MQDAHDNGAANTTRRVLIAALASGDLLRTAWAAPAQASSAIEPSSSASSKMKVPQLQFVYECDATLSELLQFGPTNEGQRRVIPITGGTFSGPNLKGRVLSGGADWNVLRNDGVTTVEAAYYLQTDDGVMLRVVNKGVGKESSLPDAAGAEKFFMFTTPVIEAPVGKYDWMNHTVFVATLGARSGVKNAVVIRVFKLS